MNSDSPASQVTPKLRWSRYLLPVTCTLFLAILLVWVIYAVQQNLEASRSTHSQNNLKQLGLALMNYESAFGRLPPGSVVRLPDQPYHGWQIMVLPFLESTPFYSMVDFQRPWNSPVNSPLFRIPLPGALNPSVSQTTDSEGYALSHYAGNAKLLGVNSSTKLSDLKEGLSQTVLIGEVGENYKAWGFPGNCRDSAAPPNSGPNSFGRSSRDGAFLHMADGSVRFVSNTVDPGLLKSAEETRANPVYTLSHRELRSGLNVLVQSNAAGRDVALWVPMTLIKGDSGIELLTDQDFLLIAGMGDLEYLSISGAKFTDAGLALLKDNRSLQALEVYGGTITDSGLKYLEQLPKLKVISIRTRRVTGSGIENLRRALPECSISWDPIRE